MENKCLLVETNHNCMDVIIITLFYTYTKLRKYLDKDTDDIRSIYLRESIKHVINNLDNNTSIYRYNWINLSLICKLEYDQILFHNIISQLFLTLNIKTSIKNDELPIVYIPISHDYYTTLNTLITHIPFDKKNNFIHLYLNRYQNGVYNDIEIDIRNKLKINTLRYNFHGLIFIEKGKYRGLINNDGKFYIYDNSTVNIFKLLDKDNRDIINNIKRNTIFVSYIKSNINK